MEEIVELNRIEKQLEGIDAVYYRMSLPEGVYEYMGSGATIVFGHASEEFLSNPLLIQKLIHPDYSDYFKKEWSNLLQGEVSPSYEYKIQKSDGSVGWVFQSNRGIYNEDGELDGIEGVCQKITGYKEIERSIREKEQEFRAIADYTYDWEMWYDVDGSIKWVNQAVEKLTGYSVMECMNSSNFLLSLVEETDREVIEKIVTPKYDSERSENNISFRMMTKDGNIKWMAISYQPIKDDEGKLMGLRTSIRDVDRSTRDKMKLRDMKYRYQHLFQKSPTPNFEANYESVIPLIEKIENMSESDAMQYILSNLEEVQEIASSISIISANEEAVKILGGNSQEDLLGSMVKFIPPEAIQDLASLLITLSKGARQWEKETLLLTLDEKVLNVKVKVAVPPDNGGYSSVIMTLTNITERIQYEKELSRRNAVLSSINSLYNKAISSDSVEEVAEYCLQIALNNSESRFGFIGEINEQGDFDTIALSDLGWDECLIEGEEKTILIKGMKIRGYWARAMSEKCSVIVNHPDQDSGKIGVPTGHPPILRYIAAPLWRGDEVVGMIGLANKDIDYTNSNLEDLENLSNSFVEALYSKKSELALRRSREELGEEQRKLLSIFNGIEEVIYVTDPETSEVLFVNKHFEELLGKNPVGSLCYESFQGLKETCDFCTNEQIRLLDGEPYHWEYHNPLLDRYFMITDRLIKWSDGRMVRFEIAIDITEQKKTAFKLRNTQEQLVRKERLAILGQISGGIGHELRNPLAAMKNGVFFLNMVLEEPDQDTQETLNILDKEISNCERIINSLLEYARPKPAAKQKLHLKEILETTLNSIEIPEVITLDTSIGENIPCLLGDVTQIERVLHNLITNASQAMPEGGSIIIGIETKEKHVEISVRDTGVGIKEENIEKLFEPLYTTKAKGIGLGLAIVKMFVERHGGEISVTSELGKGSTFRVLLPKPEEVPK